MRDRELERAVELAKVDVELSRFCFLVHGGTACGCAFITATGTANLEVRSTIHVRRGLTERRVARRSRSHGTPTSHAKLGQNKAYQSRHRQNKDRESRGDERGSPNGLPRQGAASNGKRAHGRRRLTSEHGGGMNDYHGGGMNDYQASRTATQAERYPIDATRCSGACVEHQVHKSHLSSYCRRWQAQVHHHCGAVSLSSRSGPPCAPCTVHPRRARVLHLLTHGPHPALNESVSCT